MVPTWHQSQKELSISDLKNHQQEPITNRKESSIIGPDRKRGILHLLQEINYPSNSTSEKSLSPWTLIFLQWTFIQNNHFQLPSFSLYKVTFFPHLYLLDLLMVFAVTCLSWIPIPYYSWIKPFWGLNNWLLFLKSTLLGVRSGIQKWTPKTSQAGKWTQPTGPTSFLPTLGVSGPNSV